MGALSDKIEALTAEIEKLKAQAPTPVDDAAVARHRDAIHQLSERRTSQFNPFTREQLAAMQAACPDPQAIVRDHRGAPTGPARVIPNSPQPTNAVRSVPGDGTGWFRETPIGPPPGVAQADRLMDAQDRRDRRDRLAEDARRWFDDKS